MTINNVANDGGNGGGEKDNVRTDVENLAGGPGIDTLTGSGLDNRILGPGGNDNIHGGGGDDESIRRQLSSTSATPGNDRLAGDGGDDNLFGGDGGDDLTGGDGYDFTDYSQAAPATARSRSTTSPTTALAGEGDNVMDTVEGVLGGTGDDMITGSSAANTLFGGAGADHLHGANGPDLLDGETPGSSGGFGADHLDGGGGGDTASYRSHSFNGVTVTIDGVANDGFGGEGDDVDTEHENLIGGDGQTR